jgi:hypothetical protein
VCLNAACDIALSQEGGASWFVRGDVFHGAASNLDALLAVILFCGCEEGGADGVFVMVEFMFLNSVHVGFLFALVSANLNDLISDGRHGDVVVALGCQSGRIWGLGYGHGVAAVFVDSRNAGVVRLYRCIGEERKECGLTGLRSCWSESGVRIVWLCGGRDNFIGGWVDRRGVSHRR